MLDSLIPMTGSVGLDGIRRRGARVPGSTADTRDTAAATSADDGARASRRDERISKVLLLSAIAAAAVLVLLLPVTPLVGIVLLSAISLGVAATLVRRAEARRSTGETLEGLGTKGYLLLTDRVAPGLTGTIRHLVIGPAGVFVVETRDQSGRVRIRGDQLVIGRLSHSVASQLRAQVGAVAATLAPILDGTGATVVPLICMRHAEMPLLHRSVAGIPLLRESQLERRISRATRVLDDATVVRLGELADLSMPRTSRRRAQALQGAEQDAVPAADPVTLPTGLALPAGRS